ncbi:MAG: TadE/TadG family type IV pilus assembly protein [Terracidiphilus sp.]
MKQSGWFKRFVPVHGSDVPAPTRPGGKYLRGEDGQELVEFALAASVLFTFIFGLMELCIVLFTFNSVGEAAREASRWASVRGTTSSVTSGGTTSCANPNITACPAQATDIQNYAEKLPGISASNVTVSVSWCNSDGVTNCTTSEANATPGNVVKVNVSYVFASVPFVTNKTLSVSSTSENVIWQ